MNIMRILLLLALSSFCIAQNSFVGGQINDSSALPNTGVRITVNVMQNNQVTWLWISELLSTGHWAQGGVNYLTSDGSPQAFFEVWKPDFSGVVAGGPSRRVKINYGLHVFELMVQNGTTWTFKIDSKTIGTFDVGADGSNGPGAYPIEALAENSAPVQPVSFSGLQVFRNGAWAAPTGAVLSFEQGTYGVAGNAQDSSIPIGTFLVGTSIPVIASGVALW